MALAFPNASRSYDEVRKAIRFSGHDGMFEIRFYVEAEAIAGMRSPPTQAEAVEASLLSAFDRHRTSIYDAAQKAYSRGRSNVFTLTATDFH
ncbi:DUF1488 family protein [Rhizobium alvei]|uniref:DUF1488 domain-containing protein n=1 Tax=Rhizobium alvei TaxID=1132659 RepID=A0ABT8YQG1_9HYPH|nr:DUF1488 domain-containing protein [Rhizobium alvei]MDO6965557.1 DUF1488 domain-containing protein [Rhizobium alvei]